MSWTEDSNGIRIIWNMNRKRWEYPDGSVFIDRKRRTLCERCQMPTLDLNGVENCDFCLQGLTSCEYITDACCGHGDDSLAYIALKDGRRFVLDQMKWCDE